MAVVDTRAGTKTSSTSCSRGRGVQPGGRPRPACARVPTRREGPRGPDAPLRRGLHPPPVGRRPDLRRAAARRADRSRPRSSTTSSRTRRRSSTTCAPSSANEIAQLVEGVDEADPDQLPEPRAGGGRELPQDDRRDGAGRARHPDQARRPAPQHAHDRVPRQAEAGAEGARDARGLRAARAPPRHPQAQVGARGPLLRDPAPAQVRRRSRRWWPTGAPTATRRSTKAATILAKRARRRSTSRPRSGRSRQALLLDLRQDGQEGPGVQRDLRPDRHARDRRAHGRRGRRATATARSG